MKKASTKKNIKAGPRFKRSTLIIASMIALVIFGGWLLWYQRSSTIYAPNKTEVRKKFEDALGTFGSGTVIKDQGCDDRNSVGLAVYIHCDFYGENFIGHRKDVGAALRDADRQLQEWGWKRTDSSDTYEAVFSGRNMLQLPYSRQGIRVSLIFYKDANHFSKDIRNSGLPLADYGLDTGFSMVGIWGEASYWSCSWDSIFELPCIPPQTDKSVLYKW